MLASLPHLSQHQRTTLTPPFFSSCSSHRSAKLETSNPCNHRNQQYSIVGLTNAAGTLVERYSYTAYGTLGIYDPSGTVRTISTYANRYTYTGREYDADLNLYHFRARWYDPATGGFISRDPLRYVDGVSLYRGYFGVKGRDPSGTDSWVDHYVDEQLIVGTRVAAKEKCRGTSPSKAASGSSYQPKIKSSCQITDNKFSGITLNDCRKNLAQVMLHQRIIELLASLSHGGCDVEFECVNCQPHSDALGGFVKSTGQILICMDNISPGDFTEFSDTVYQELIHTNQACWRNVLGDQKDRDKNGKWDCFGSLANEMEAYFCDGSCGQGMAAADAAKDCFIRALDSACKNCYLEELNYEVIQKALSKFVIHHINGSHCRFPGMPSP